MQDGNTTPIISLMAGTGDVTWGAGDISNTQLMGTSNVNSLVESLPAITVLAPLDSPALTGTPTAPTPGLGDNSTTVATTAYVISALASPFQLSTIGGNYTLGLSDGNTEIEFSATSTATVTISPHSTTPYPVGFSVNLRQMNTGQIVVAGGAGVTVRSPNGLKTRAQYSTISLIQSNTTDTWVVGGDSTP